MSGHDGFLGFGGGFMWLFWILFAIAMVWILKGLMSDGSNASKQTESPLDILKKRYARGEIDVEEFQRRRRELE